MQALSESQHGTVLMWTATIGTSPGRTLSQQRRDLMQLIQATTRDSFLARKGVIGTARCVEIEHGTGGWHVHSHTLLVFREAKSRPDARTFALTLLDRYLSEADRLGITAHATGQHMSVAAPVSVAVDYVTKARVRANGADTPSALWTATQAGDADALALIHDLEAASFRKRAWTLTGVCKLAPELDFDALIAAGALD